MKKAILIYLNGILIEATEVKTFEDNKEFISLHNKAEENKIKLLADKEKEKKALTNLIALNDAKHNLQCELLKLEIKLLKGEIDDEVYFERKSELTKKLNKLLGE